MSWPWPLSLLFSKKNNICEDCGAVHKEFTFPITVEVDSYEEATQEILWYTFHTGKTLTGNIDWVDENNGVLTIEEV